MTLTDYHRTTVDLQRKQLAVLRSIDRRLAELFPTGAEVVADAEAILKAMSSENESNQ